MEHDGGHLPFEAEVTDLLNYGESNVITVASNNTLTPTTLPPGKAKYLEGGYVVLSIYIFIFFIHFNYICFIHPRRLVK